MRSPKRTKRLQRPHAPTALLDLLRRFEVTPKNTHHSCRLIPARIILVTNRNDDCATIWTLDKHSDNMDLYRNNHVTQFISQFRRFGFFGHKWMPYVWRVVYCSCSMVRSVGHTRCTFRRLFLPAAAGPWRVKVLFFFFCQKADMIWICLCGNEWYDQISNISMKWSHDDWFPRKK